jgi:putative acetyltransferase
MIKPAQPSDPAVRFLVAAQQQELRAIYEGRDDATEPFEPVSLEGAGSLLLVCEEGGEWVACGALVRLEDGETAEVKRMYTAPLWRGRGKGKALLAALIAGGKSAGYRRLVLETGTLQPEAVALYERAGFVRVANYGAYRGVETSLCFALDL